MYARLNSFTLMEVIVAMLISGIVLSMAAFAYFRITEWHTLDMQRQQDENLWHRLEFALRQDFLQANRIETEDGKKVLIENSKQTVFYTFEEKQVLRKTVNYTDTIRLSCSFRNKRSGIIFQFFLKNRNRQLVLQKEFPVE